MAVCSQKTDNATRDVPEATKRYTMAVDSQKANNATLDLSIATLAFA